MSDVLDDLYGGYSPIARIIIELQRQAERALEDDPEGKLPLLRAAGQTTTGAWVFEDWIGVPTGRRPMPPRHWSPDRPTLIKLLSRVYQHRVRRLDMQTGIVAPMPAAWRDIVRRHFSTTFQSTIGVGSGWGDLILAMAGMLSEVGTPFEIYDVEELFGALNLRTVGEHDVGDEIVSCAVHLSQLICEECGGPGRNRKGGDWMRTLCDEHAAGD